MRAGVKIAAFSLGIALSQLPCAVPAEEVPGLSLFGVPGHVNMPSAFALPDGVFALSVNAQGGGVRRGNLVFQITPRLTGTFRYGYLADFNIDEGGISLYDRSFDLVYQITTEDRQGWRPAIALGLQDFGGTGVYGAEYLVASRHFGPDVAASAGIGWGRLGSHGSFGNPLGALSDRFDHRPWSGTTGEVAFDRLFRGDAALFFGMDWQASDRLRLSLEYSSDGMVAESRIIGFDHRTPVNLGLEYRLANGAELGLAILHGSSIALGYSMILDPARPAALSGREAAPPPVLPGSGDAAASWAPLPDAGRKAQLAAALRAQGIDLDGVVVEGDTATVAIRNPTWPAAAQAWGRAMRVLSAELPAGITTFRLQSRLQGMPMQDITLTRQDLEALEYAPDGAWQAWLRAQGTDAAGLADPRLQGGPLTDLRLRPYVEPSFFDPDSPLRLDLGAELQAEWSPLPGLVFAGALRQKLAGNLDSITRRSDSVLPHVRSDAALYFRDDGPRLTWATAEYFFRPGADLYGRLTLGLLEPMYGGASAELLWAAPDRRLALGLEVNHATQRDFDGFGFRDYSIVTGHASAYYDLGGGYHAQLDMGRYLAGDWGATATMTRRFGNGFEVAAFMTLTDVSAAEFGEGSFDKGITIRVPLPYVTGQPSRQKPGVTLRPILRDGGARLSVRNRLYALTQDDRDGAEGLRWARFWR